MNREEKFEEVFGVKPDTAVCFLDKHCADCKLNKDAYPRCVRKWWKAKYKEPVMTPKKVCVHCGYNDYFVSAGGNVYCKRCSGLFFKEGKQ